MAHFPKISGALKKRAAQIELLLMDVDGTMTDGGVILLSQTEEIALEIKTFDAHDGQGLTLAHTLPAFALAALPDAKARLYFGAPAK
jgi:3-deoxy-D-manno-octulosonate 8-phosphate phosphatase KdsC-like HAD superfamily phosphatase